MQPVNFLVPVKWLDQSKSRLGSILSPAERAGLVEQLLNENLRKLSSFFPEHNILVVTPDPRVADIAKKYAADVLLEEKQNGLNSAVESGTQWAKKRGFDVQVVISPDVPYLCATEIKLILAEIDGAQKVVIGAAKDKGTNAILTSPPDVIPFRFGKNSSEVMAAHAAERGICCTEVNLPNLAFDIDTPVDFFAFKPGCRSSFFGASGLPELAGSLP